MCHSLDNSRKYFDWQTERVIAVGILVIAQVAKIAQMFEHSQHGGHTRRLLTCAFARAAKE